MPFFLIFVLALLFSPLSVHAQERLFESLEEFGIETTQQRVMEDYPVVRLQSLDKISARTETFEARVGSTVRFGSLFIKAQACRKAPPIEEPESAAFLQVWEVEKDAESPQAGESQWVFSGWMFASSPALSPMDHPVFDVWVLDCLEGTADAEEESAVEEEEATSDEAAEDTNEQIE